MHRWGKEYSYEQRGDDISANRLNQAAATSGRSFHEMHFAAKQGRQPNQGQREKETTHSNKQIALLYHQTHHANPFDVLH